MTEATILKFRRKEENKGGGQGLNITIELDADGFPVGLLIFGAEEDAENMLLIADVLEEGARLLREEVSGSNSE